MAFKRPGVRPPSAPPENTKGSVQDAALFCARCRAAFVITKKPPWREPRGFLCTTEDSLLNGRENQGTRFSMMHSAVSFFRSSKYWWYLSQSFPTGLAGLASAFVIIQSPVAGP